MKSAVRLKSIATVVAGQSPSADDVAEISGGLPFIQGNAEFGAFHPSPIWECETAPKVARPGDLLLSVRAPVGALNVSSGRLGIGRGVAAIRAMDSRCQRWLYWALEASRGDLISRATGSTFGAVSSSDIGELRLLPPRNPRQIADYLDHETAEIDAFIADLLALGAVTQERILSEWSRLFAVASKARSIQVRHVVSSLVDGPFGSALTSAHYSDTGTPVVRLGNIGHFEFSVEPRVFVPTEYALALASHDVRPNDVVIAGLGDANHPLGRSAVVPEIFGAGIVKADCYRARVNTLVTSDYLAWVLSAPQTADTFRELSRGSTRARLNLGVVSAARIPVPDPSEQQRLVRDFRRSKASASDVLADVDAAILLAKERRAALITAAVTGQIDVTTTHPPVVDSIQTAIDESR